MAGSIWRKFVAMFTIRGESDEEENADDDGRFVPSPLDLSVLTAHGASVGELESEIFEIKQQAKELDEEANLDHQEDDYSRD